MSDLFHPDIPLDFIQRVFATMAETPHPHLPDPHQGARSAWPPLAHELDWPPNVWMGVSVESQRYTFRNRPPPHRPSRRPLHKRRTPPRSPCPNLDLAGIHWLIAGGESGPRARPMN